MAITFNTNLAALGAQRNIGIASNAASSSLQKLSSGSRVPQAKDDAAGLAIGSKLKSEVAGLTQASNNAAQAISLLQIADGALSTVGDILQRMKALAVQSSSGQLADSDRSLLNQEFTNLQDEVDRVSSVTNFNGTTLLAGSTTVTSKVNSLAAYNGTNATSATNLIGTGFDSIDFANNASNGAIKIEYTGASHVMTVTDLATNKKQSITLDAATIAAGKTEDYNFGDVGVKISLNSSFNKATAIAGADVAATNATAASFTGTPSVGNAGLTGGTNAFTISNISFTGTGSNEIAAGALAGASIAISGAVATVSLGSLVIGGHTFTQAAATTVAAAGAHNWVMSDGQGNSFTVTDTSTGTNTGTASGNIVLSTTAGTIESTGTGVNAPAVTKVVEAAAPNAFDFSKVDNARVTINTAAAGAAVGSIVLNGVTFTSAGVDLTTAGVKTMTLADANGNSFDVQFNVTKAFTSGAGNARIDLGQFGQLVSSTSVTSGTTNFDFKVGTGTTINDSISFGLTSATTATLGIGASSIDTAANANTAIDALNAAINGVSSRRADIGAAQSRLDFASNSISVSIENTTAAASALLDVDVSSEITNFTNENVLMQAGISLLGQANQQPALLLRLLQ